MSMTYLSSIDSQGFILVWLPKLALDAVMCKKAVILEKERDMPLEFPTIHARLSSGQLYQWMCF